MFIAKNGDLIVQARETREELEQVLEYMEYDTIEETNEKYVLVNGEYLTEAQAAEKERERKINTIKAALAELDAQAIRPLRAILTDCATDEDREVLRGIETQASVLREELSSFL